MDPAAARYSFGGGVITGLALPTLVSVLSDGREFFEPRGLGTALAVAVLAVACLLVSGGRNFALGALLGAATYFPLALLWAVDHGMSLGG